MSREPLPPAWSLPVWMMPFAILPCTRSAISVTYHCVCMWVMWVCLFGTDCVVCVGLGAGVRVVVGHVDVAASLA